MLSCRHLFNGTCKTCDNVCANFKPLSEGNNVDRCLKNDTRKDRQENMEQTTPHQSKPTIAQNCLLVSRVPQVYITCILMYEYHRKCHMFMLCSYDTTLFLDGNGKDNIYERHAPARFSVGLSDYFCLISDTLSHSSCARLLQPTLYSILMRFCTHPPPSAYTINLCTSSYTQIA